MKALRAAQKIKVYRLSPHLIIDQVNKKCAAYETSKRQQLAYVLAAQQRYAIEPNLFTVPPDEPALVISRYNSWIRTERNYYALVRVVRRHGEYFLVYGQAHDTVAHGTGPFKTVNAAKAWFLNGGR